MYRVKLRFCIDGVDAEINERILDGLREMMAANMKDDRFFISKEDHLLICNVIPGLTHLEFLEMNSGKFRDGLREGIMGCDQLTSEEQERFLGVVDLLEEISDEQVIVNKYIPPLFETTKKV